MRSSKTTRTILLSVIGGLLLAGSVDVAWGQPCQATEFAQLLASEAQEGDWFGSSVAIDADTAVIGAFGDVGFTGAAYVFRFDGSSWVQEAKLTASDGKETDEFSGYGVAINGDWIVIGACQTDDVEPENPMCESGSAYMFKRPPTGWENMTETLKLTALDAACGDYFGFTVAIEGDTTVVSAKGDEGGTGAVYVFERDEGGPDNWGQVAKLTASDADDNYGLAESVSISGNTIVAGTPDPCPGETCGAAYIFEKPPNGWTDMTETVKLDFPPGADGVGYTVSISGDVAMVGSPWEPVEVGFGAVYVFERDQGGPDNWGQAAKLTASDSDPDDVFGESLSLDGDMAVIASPWDIVEGYVAGSVYVFQFDGTDWIEEAKLTPSDVEEDLQEEAFVAMSGGTAVFGRPIEEGDPRPAYVYTYLSDCDSSGTLDACEIEDGTLHDDDHNGIPDECECPGDVDGDGNTDWSDLAIMIADWGCMSDCIADLDGDGDTDLGDLVILIAHWGCPDDDPSCDEPDPGVIDASVTAVDNTSVNYGDDPLEPAFDGGVTHFTFDLQVQVDPDQDWAVAEVDGLLTEPDAEFFLHAHTSYPPGDPPDPDDFDAYPALEFDSYWCGASAIPPGGSGTPSFQVWLDARTTTQLSALWFDVEDTGGGTFTIARFTIAVPPGSEMHPAVVSVDSGGGDPVLGTVIGWVTNASYDPGCDWFLLDVIDCSCPGDIDGDCDTDQSDLGILLAAWQTCVGDPDYNPFANLYDESGPSEYCIDQQDLGVLLSDWHCHVSP